MVRQVGDEIRHYYLIVSGIPKDELNKNINNTIIKAFEIDQESFESKFYKLPYQTPQNKKFRVIQIGDFPLFLVAGLIYQLPMKLVMLLLIR